MPAADDHIPEMQPEPPYWTDVTDAPPPEDVKLDEREDEQDEVATEMAYDEWIRSWEDREDDAC